jgi:hypothetical protein
MQKLNQLWQALERCPGLIAALAFWQEWCGLEFPVVEAFLRPTDELASTYPCPHPTGSECPRSIVDLGDGEYVAVCRDPWKICGDVAVPPKDALLHRIDIAVLTKAVAAPLGIRSHAPEERRPCAWAFGILATRSRLQLPAFLVCAHSQASFSTTIRDLLLASSSALIVVAPTRNYQTVDLQEQLTSRQCEFISLEDSIGVDERGQFAALERAAASKFLPTPVEKRQRVVNDFKEKHAYTVDVICQDAQVHRSDFYKWLRGDLADHLGKSKRIEDFLRSDPALRTHR